MKGGQPGPMRVEQVVTKADNIIQAEFRRRVRIQHGGVVYVLFVMGERSLNGQQLHVDIGTVQSC